MNKYTIMILFLITINIIVYYIKHSDYANKYARNMNDFYIPILTSISLILGLIIGKLLTCKIDNIIRRN